jgi:hypothetical protein
MCKIVGKVSPDTLKNRAKKEARARRVRVSNQDFSRKVREEVWGKLKDLKES